MRRAAGVCALLLAGCGGDSAEGPGAAGPAFEVTDSAGVEIVTNGVALDALPEWTLSAEPTVVLGDGSDERSQLYRVGGAATLPDGAIAVLNRSSREILVFEPDGSFRVVFGGEGVGPGEFRDPRQMLWRNGGFHVWDRGTGRVSTIEPTGEMRRTATIRSEAGFVPSHDELVQVLPDGSSLFRDDRSGASESFSPVHTLVVRYGPGGSPGDTVAEVVRAVRGRVVLTDYDGSAVGTMQHERFGPIADFAPAPGGYFFAGGRRHEVELHSANGELRRVVRWSGPELRPSAADLDEIRAIEDSVVGEFPAARDSYAQWPVADSLPAYDAVTSDAGGGFWVRLYRRPWEPGPHVWLAFDADGRLTARVTLPSGTHVLEAAPSHVLLLHTDDLRVERILRYELRRLDAAG